MYEDIHEVLRQPGAVHTDGQADRDAEQAAREKLRESRPASEMTTRTIAGPDGSGRPRIPMRWLPGPALNPRPPRPSRRSITPRCRRILPVEAKRGGGRLRSIYCRHCWCQRMSLTAETRIQVLAHSGVAVDRSNAADVAVARLVRGAFPIRSSSTSMTPETGALVLEGAAARWPPDRNPPVTVPCYTMLRQIRSILGAGDSFSSLPAHRLRASSKHLARCTALLKRERRQFRCGCCSRRQFHSYRRGAYRGKLLLRLEHGGMDVRRLALPSAALVHCHLRASRLAAPAWKVNASCLEYRPRPNPACAFSTGRQDARGNGRGWLPVPRMLCPKEPRGQPL